MTDQIGAARGALNALGITIAAGALAVLLGGTAFAAAGGEPDNTHCNGRGNPASRCVPGQPGAGNGGQGGAAEARASARAVGIGQGGRASATGGSASATGGTASVTVQGGGGGYVEARDRLRVPDANAPAIWSNNPCVVGLSGGVAVAGFGASIGAGIEDRDCTRRANAQHLVSMGEREAAREVLCESAEVRAAFARIGRPCAADRPAVVSVAAPAVREVIGGGAAPAPRQRPAWCDTLRARGMVARECE